MYRQNVPQCQRSPNSTRLDLLAPSPPGIWTCPGEAYGAIDCPGGETYEVTADDFHEPAVRAMIARTSQEFGVTPPIETFLVILGETPQHIVWEERSEIYVRRASARNSSFFWEAAHEVFHHVCTPAGLLHWSHEMLATLWAARYLAEIGQQAYAEACVAQALAQSERCPLDLMLGLDSLPYPDGLYGRALITGHRLEAAIGWETLRTLASSFNADGRPEFDNWQSTLSTVDAERVRAILAT